jgi:hypothetical protein
LRRGPADPGWGQHRNCALEGFVGELLDRVVDRICAVDARPPRRGLQTEDGGLLGLIGALAEIGGHAEAHDHVAGDVRGANQVIRRTAG